MTEAQFLKALYVHRLHKEEINNMVGIVLEKPSLVHTLIDAVLNEDRSDSFNASWVFDHTMRKNLPLLLPYIDNYVNALPLLTSESCLRPMAHTCELLVMAYYKHQKSDFREALALRQLEKLLEVNFDWLIGEHKVATKVFAMTSLFYLGETFDWVRPELKLILQGTIAKGTAGFKNRGQKILDKLHDLGF